MKIVIRMFVVILVLGSTSMSGRPQPAADWTVMIYMNGKNNLEPDAIANFLQLAEIDSTPNINVIVEMGRPKNHYTNDYGAWSGVRRFRVTKNSEPTANAAVSALSDQQSDMGSATTLADFVRWAREAYPAKHQMLIIWNHGQGWRFQIAANRALRERAALQAISNVAEAAKQVQRPPGGFRSISFDDDTNHFLYNRDIQDVLQGTHLDIIAFDACLMSMIETAYAFRGLASFMVGSEELEPGSGWPYDKWLKRLAGRQNVSPSELAKISVEAYRDRYGNAYRTTMSAIDLSHVPALASAVSAFSRSLRGALGTEAPALHTARLSCRTYGEDVGLQTSVDLALLMGRYIAHTSNANLIVEAKAIQQHIRAAVISNYASKRVQGDFGSNGVAIYFPATMASFDADRPDSDGYRPENQEHPVEFVQTNVWAFLLHDYLGKYAQ